MRSDWQKFFLGVKKEKKKKKKKEEEEDMDLEELRKFLIEQME